MLFNILVFIFFFVSIRARCNWPQLLRVPANVLSVCQFVCLFVCLFFWGGGEANKIKIKYNKKQTNKSKKLVGLIYKNSLKV